MALGQSPLHFLEPLTKQHLVPFLRPSTAFGSKNHLEPKLATQPTQLAQFALPVYATLFYLRHDPSAIE